MTIAGFLQFSSLNFVSNYSSICIVIRPNSLYCDCLSKIGIDLCGLQRTSVALQLTYLYDHARQLLGCFRLDGGCLDGGIH